MQLYNSAFSPYAARCRIQIYHKGLPVEIVAPPGGMGSATIKAKNAIGKIPVLDLGERSLAESWAIMEYLEATHPQTPMRSNDAFEQAQLQALVRFGDLYLATALFPLFRALRGAVGPEGIAEALPALQIQLQTLEQLLATAKPHSEALDLADAALLPIVWYARILVRHFGKTDCLADLPLTTQWWQRSGAVPAAAKVLAEMDAGLRAAMPMLFQNN
ncbi:MAG TPA: glutathione S-transferase [Fontimonas sp.]